MRFFEIILFRTAFCSFSALLLAVCFLSLLLWKDGFSCRVERETKTVRGQSMEPFLRDGQDIEVLVGYYACHAVGRDDTVVIRNASNASLLVKNVKGVPGDLLNVSEDKNEWRIEVNGSTVVNSEGHPYIADKRRAEMLRLYQKSYHGVIPEGAYLVLGDQLYGSLDSMVFGLIGKEEIAGRVVK